MKYPVVFKPRAQKDIKALSSENQKRVLARLEDLANDLTGDVKRLTNFTPEYRMRAGDYRVLFQIEDGSIIVYRVLHRGAAYR